MTDTTPAEGIGNNSRERLNGLARMISDDLDVVSSAQERIKTLKAEAKSEGFNLKALGQVIKEMRKGPAFQAAQLELELVLDTYREAAGQPTTLEAAQQLAAEAAGEVPDKPAKKGKQPANDDGEDKPKRAKPERKDLN